METLVRCVKTTSSIIINSPDFLIQRAVLKFAKYTGAAPVAGRFTPGTFTNQIQKAFREPRLLVVADPITDNQVRDIR